MGSNGKNEENKTQQAKKVFISYSHDTVEHKRRVLELSDRLRDGGINADIDQYLNGTPRQTWPRWMLDQIDWADYVLCVCTETYYRRFRGHEGPETGKGVDWEGAVITQEIYDTKNRTIKFVPVVFNLSDKQFIPEPLSGRTSYVLNTEDEYESLYDFLLDQSGILPRPLGTPKIKERQQIERTKFEDARPYSQQPTGEEKESSNKSYVTFNDDREIKEIVSKNIHEILDNEVMKCVEQALKSCIESKSNKPVTRVSDALVDLPVLDALVNLENALKKCFNFLSIREADKGIIRCQWQASVDIFGWLLLLTVSPEWRIKHKSIFQEKKTLNFKLSVNDEHSSEIVVSSLLEKPSCLSRNKSNSFDKSCNFLVELGIDKSDIAEQLAKAIYRAFYKTNKDEKVKSGYLVDLRAKLRAQNYRNEHRYIAVDVSEDQNPLNDPGVYQRLIELLPELNLIYLGAKDTDLDVLLIPEPDVLENIELFLAKRPQIEGV